MPDFGDDFESLKRRLSPVNVIPYKIRVSGFIPRKDNSVFRESDCKAGRGRRWFIEVDDN